MMGTGNGEVLKLLARPSYHAALMERLKMAPSELRSHPFRERLDVLLAEVERAYTGSVDRLGGREQHRREIEELKEQYAPLFWHYLGRALRAVGEVEFALMEARMHCLLREFWAEMGRLWVGPGCLGSGSRWL